MSVVCLNQERIVVGSELTIWVVVQNSTLNFFQIFYFVLRKCTVVDNVLQKWLFRASIFSPRRNFSHYCNSVFVTFLKSLFRLICAHKYHAQILILKVSVNIEHVFFWAARHTNCGPVFTLRHGFESPYVVKNDIDIFKIRDGGQIYLEVLLDRICLQR